MILPPSQDSHELNTTYELRIVTGTWQTLSKSVTANSITTIILAIAIPQQLACVHLRGAEMEGWGSALQGASLRSAHLPTAPTPAPSLPGQVLTRSQLVRSPARLGPSGTSTPLPACPVGLLLSSACARPLLTGV